MTNTASATTNQVSRKLTLADIADVRAYERERDSFRAEVIALKARRRVSVGTLVTFLFENRATMRFQIQEMARVEKLVTDEAIQGELDAYNPLIPEAGQLCATMFIELTSDDQVREWLSKLAGVEHSVVVRLADGSEVRGQLDAQHESQLTRPDVTAAVHYLTFTFTPAQVDAFRESVSLRTLHPNYTEHAVLTADTIAELRTDLVAD